MIISQMLILCQKLIFNLSSIKAKKFGCIINVGVVNKKLLQHFYFFDKKI